MFAMGQWASNQFRLSESLMIFKMQILTRWGFVSGDELRFHHLTLLLIWESTSCLLVFSPATCFVNITVGCSCRRRRKPWRRRWVFSARSPHAIPILLNLLWCMSIRKQWPFFGCQNFVRIEVKLESFYPNHLWHLWHWSRYITRVGLADCARKWVIFIFGLTMSMQMNCEPGLKNVMGISTFHSYFY